MPETPAAPILGVCQWFHYEDFQGVRDAAAAMRRLGLRHLRTGVSWADFHRPRGRAWYDWQMEQLAEFDVLLSVWHTPPSIAEGNRCAGPPRRLEEYGEFIGYLIELYGDQFSHLELWNEPNNRLKWDFRAFDPNWAKFGRMIRFAAGVAREQGKPTVLGGMIPVDHHWLELVESHGALEEVDIIAIHGFPEMWWPDRPNWEWHRNWRGWKEKIDYIARSTDKPIWITETGLATWDFSQRRPGRFDLQCLMLGEAARAPADRVYWYSLIDLDPAREAIEGFHVDENEYHLGVLTHDLKPKPAWQTMKTLLDEQAEAAPCGATTSAGRFEVAPLWKLDA
jgi:CDP-paratose 2-epimerase